MVQRRTGNTMTNFQIRQKLKKLRERLVSIEHSKESTLLEIKQVQEQCQHKDKKKWTNNDGDGQFIVERCEVCGLQRDGGLR